MYIRGEAISALGMIMRTQEEAALIVPLLEAIALDREDPSRFEAIEGLASTGAPGGVDALARLFHEFQQTADRERFSVMAMLDRTPDPRGREVLKSLWDVDDSLVREQLELFKVTSHPWPAPPPRLGVTPPQNCNTAPSTQGGVFLLLLMTVFSLRRRSVQGPAKL